MNPYLAILLALGASKEEGLAALELINDKPIPETEEQGLADLKMALREVRGSTASDDAITPMGLFDVLREKAVDAVKLTFMEVGQELPDDVLTGLLKPVIAVAIGTTSQHYAQHPEHLPLAAMAICEVCREPVQSLQVGVDPSREGDVGMVKVAWPCGHFQP